VQISSDPFDEPLKWPRNGDKLFGLTGDRHLQVYIAGGTEFHAHVEGYKRAGDKLIEELRKEPRLLGTNYLVFPVVFLYRHFVELSIKDVVAHGTYFATGRSEFPQHHDLVALWREARKVFERIRGCGPEDLDAVGSLIAELNAIDPQSFSFRYPMKKDWQPSLPERRSSTSNSFPKASTNSRASSTARGRCCRTTRTTTTRWTEAGRSTFTIVTDAASR
jgi:hypothetical protein